jgi:hypothetical protein
MPPPAPLPAAQLVSFVSAKEFARFPAITPTGMARRLRSERRSVPCARLDTRTQLRRANIPYFAIYFQITESHLPATTVALHLEVSVRTVLRVQTIWQIESEHRLASNPPFSPLPPTKQPPPLAMAADLDAVGDRLLPGGIPSPLLSHRSKIARTPDNQFSQRLGSSGRSQGRKEWRSERALTRSGALRNLAEIRPPYGGTPHLHCRRRVASKAKSRQNDGEAMPGTLDVPHLRPGSGTPLARSGAPSTHQSSRTTSSRWSS